VGMGEEEREDRTIGGRSRKEDEVGKEG
jgi:hypothetical protein